MLYYLCNESAKSCCCSVLASWYNVWVKKMYCRLAVLIKEKDTRLSQRELSRATGLSTATVNKLHNNEFDRVDAATIEKLCDYFNCEVGDLLVLKKIEEKV